MPLSVVAGAIGHVGMEFESKMSGVQATSQSTGEDLKKLEDQALSLGQSTSFSASECADGMQALASSGLDASQIMSALPGTLDAAASSGEELGAVTQIVTGTMNGFGMAAKDTGHIADVLAKSSADTNANIASMGEAFQYCATPANAAKQSFEETAAAIGIMSDNSIMGSQAGTTLRGVFTRLAKPSEAAAKSMENLGFKAYDSSGKMLPLATIIDNLKESTKGLTDEQKQNFIATVFGQEAMSGMLALMNAGGDKIRTLTDGFKNCDGAAKDMATTMQDNTKASVEQAMGALETAGIKALKVAAPAIKEVAEDIGTLADKFSELDPQTQEFIVKAGMAAIVLPPLTSGLGRTVSGIGSLIKVGGKAASALGLISTGAEIASVATTGVGVAAPIAIGVAAIAAVGYAGYKTAKYLNEDATESVDLFADKSVYSTQQVATAHGTMTAQVQTDTIKISKATKDAVGSYLDMDKKASSSLMDLRINSDKFSKEAKDKVIKNFTDMSKKSSNLSKEQREAMTVDFKKLVSDTGTLTDKNKREIIKHYADMVNGTKDLSNKQKVQLIKDFQDTLNKSTSITTKQSQELQKIYTDMSRKITTGLDTKRDEDLKSQKDFFSKSNALTEKEEQDILKKTTDSWNKKKENIDSLQKQINDIIQKAADEHRQISDSEAKSIDEIQKKMKDNAVKVLSENEVQAKVILERMKDNDESITAEQASEHIKTLNKSRDEAVKAANDECDKRIAEAIRMRDETKVISAEQCDKLIEDAKKQKDETVKAAENTRTEAVEKITSMNSEISQNVDTTTGDILSRWDKFKRWWSGWTPEPKNLTVTETHYSDGRGGVEHNWTGDSYFKGGYTTLHENGWELYDLPQGSRIYNHESSEALVQETARQTAQGLLDNFASKLDSIIGNASNTNSNNTPKNITIKTDLHINNLNEASKYDLEHMLNERDKQIVRQLAKSLEGSY